MKTCTVCKATKPLQEFHSDKSKKDGRLPRCAPCRIVQQRERYGKNYERYRAEARIRYQADLKLSRLKSNAASLKTRYGITLEDKNRMLALQNSLCPICLRSAEKFKKGLYVDHCHKTGIVRGLLCPSCNHGLGLFVDNPEALIRAAEYLKRSKK